MCSSIKRWYVITELREGVCQWNDLSIRKQVNTHTHCLLCLVMWVLSLNTTQVTSRKVINYPSAQKFSRKCGHISQRFCWTDLHTVGVTSWLSVGHVHQQLWCSHTFTPQLLISTSHSASSTPSRIFQHVDRKRVGRTPQIISWKCFCPCARMCLCLSANDLITGQFLMRISGNVPWCTVWSWPD